MSLNNLTLALASNQKISKFICPVLVGRDNLMERNKRMMRKWPGVGCGKRAGGQSLTSPFLACHKFPYLCDESAPCC